MRRLWPTLAVLLLALPSQAQAYAAPSALNVSGYSALCPPRPADAGGAVPNPVLMSQTQTVAGGTEATFGPVSVGASGPLDLSVTHGSNSENAAWIYVQVQNSAGTWVTLYRHTNAGPGSYGDSFELANVPPGPLRVLVDSGESGSDTFGVYVSAGNVNVGELTLAQEIADNCYRDAATSAAASSAASQAHADAGTAHSDASQIDGDVTAAKNTLAAIATGGISLSTLDGDLGLVAADVNNLDSDVRAGNAARGGSGTVQPVSLTAADAGVGAIGSGVSLIGGLIVGFFMAGQLLRFIWP